MISRIGYYQRLRGSMAKPRSKLLESLDRDQKKQRPKKHKGRQAANGLAQPNSLDPDLLLNDPNDGSWEGR